MPHTKDTLPNGLRVVTVARPGTPTVATKIFVKVGSRHDGEKHGLAHYLEHLFFKGTTNRTSRQIYGQVEALGGKVDAQTTKDYIAFSVVTGARYYRTGLEVLADVLLHPRFGSQDFEAERAVILEEIRRRADMRQIIWDLYDLTLWDLHPLRYRVLGYESVVEALTRDDLMAHYRRFFVPQATVIAVAGDFDQAQILADIEALCGDFSGSSPVYPKVPEEPPLAEKRGGVLERSIFQTHLVLGWPTVDMRHPDSYVLKVMDRIMGVGGNCRLYQELRERQGLVYAAYTVRAEHEDAGHFSVYTATDPAKVEQATTAILSEIRRLQREPVSEAELAAAKTNYEGSLAVSFETNLSLAGILGVETLLTGQFEPFEESVRRVRAVTQDDILRVANQYLDTDRYAIAMVGQKPL